MSTLRNSNGYGYSYTDGTLIRAGDRIRWSTATHLVGGGYSREEGSGTVVSGEGASLNILTDNALHKSCSKLGVTDLQHTGEPITLWFQGKYDSEKKAYGFSGQITADRAHLRSGCPSCLGMVPAGAVDWGCYCNATEDEIEDANAEMRLICD